MAHVIGYVVFKIESEDCFLRLTGRTIFRESTLLFFSTTDNFFKHERQVREIFFEQIM